LQFGSVLLVRTNCGFYHCNHNSGCNT